MLETKQEYSDTRMLIKLDGLDSFFDEEGKIRDELKFNINNSKFKIQNSKFPCNPDDKFETALFLPEGEGRKGEGGLRTKGYLKSSYKLVDGDWYICDFNGEIKAKVPDDIRRKIDDYFQSIKHQTPITNYQSQITSLPLISVITVVLNGEKYLEQTIQSVINQTYPNVEYIIIDGGSTDGTLDIIRKYEHAIDYWVSERDKGIYDAMNKGIDLANGKWIYFLGSDDKFYSDKTLSNIFWELNDQIDLFCGRVKSGNTLINPKFGFKTYLHNSIHHQGAIYNKKLFNNFRYDIRFSIASDYELNLILHLNKNTSTKFANIICSKCRNDGISIVRAQNAFEEMKKIRSKYFSKPINIVLNILLYVKIKVHKIFKRIDYV